MGRVRDQPTAAPCEPLRPHRFDQSGVLGRERAAGIVAHVEIDLITGGHAVAHPDALVIDIDGDGSFQMNVQELATCFCEKLPVKVVCDLHPWMTAYHMPLDHTLVDVTNKNGTLLIVAVLTSPQVAQR